MQLQTKIYIPIWFYSNGKQCKIVEVDEKFTFQYGSIQIKTKEFGDHVSNLFTFQYGSIQIDTITIRAYPLNEFTFQYGSIQINRKC